MRYSLFPAVLACAVLAGCAGPVPDDTKSGAPKARGFLAGLTKTPATAPLRRAKLAGGAVVVAGPEDYCIDPKTVKTNANRSFAVVASCEILSQGKDGTYVEPIVMTVTVGRRGSQEDMPTATDLARALEAELLAGGEENGLTLAHLDRGGDAGLKDGAASHWRGIFAQGDRMIGLALYAPKGSDYAGSAGKSMLVEQFRQITRLSPK